MKTICITQNEDGTYSVYEEMPEAEMQEGATHEMDEAQKGEPAETIDAALDLARQMLQDDGTSEEEQVMSGYEKNKPMGMAKPRPNQVFGE
jgi:hypothetical protein